MQHPPTMALDHITRRRWLTDCLSMGLAATGLVACGGGGGDAAPDAPPDTGTGSHDTAPGGRLVFGNSSQIAVWSFGTDSGIEFDGGDRPALAGGVSAAPDGTLIVAREGDNESIGLATFDLAGRALDRFRLLRTLAFHTSTAVFNVDGTRLAISVNELAGPDDSRIDRTQVLAWPSGELLASFDGYAAPMWAGSTGELVMREAETCRLRLVGANLQDQGWLDDLTVLPTSGSYSLSRDGRYVVMEDAGRIQAFDRGTGQRWVAAERLSDLHAPTFSPDGRHLAMHAIDLTTATSTFWTYVPHIVPFSPGVTVAVAPEVTRLDRTLAFTGYPMAWLA